MWRMTRISRRPGGIEWATLLITALLVPAVILAHELGHYLAGLAFNVPNPRLGLSGFTHGPAPWLSRRQVAMIGIAGPAVSLALAAIGLARVKPGHARFAAALGVAACMRLCELLPFAVVALARLARGAPYRRTTFDEPRVFDALGLNGNIALVGASVIFAAILFAVLRRQRRGSGKSLIIGGLIGWGAWRIMLEQGLLA